MLILIVGGGRTGTQLAILLMEQGHTVRLIEWRNDVLSRLHHELPTEVIIHGKPIDPVALEQAGIKEADILAAVTTSDQENLTLCYFAKQVYKVRRTIARVNNPRNAWLFDKTFNVDVEVNQAELISRLIEEEMAMGSMMTLLKLKKGDYSLIEERIVAGARAIGIQIKDLNLPEHVVIAAIIRKGEIIVPRGITSFKAGDEVLLFSDSEGATQIKELFEIPV
ncbi:MAG: NAD-binding protein [Anaerolineaceae bacterium]|nr:NAD-binding protein [Anaerolineaceae bacterium]